MKERRNGQKSELWGSGLRYQEQEPAGRVAPDLRPVRGSGLNRRTRHSLGRFALSAGRLGRYVMRRSQTKLPKTTASTSDRHEKSRKLSRDKTCAESFHHHVRGVHCRRVAPRREICKQYIC